MIDINKYKDNNKKISELLSENHDFKYNYPNDLNEYIEIPHGYIDTVNSIINKYHLDYIITDEIKRKNLCYLLEYVDLLRFFDDYFNIWGAVSVMLYKNALINYVSFMEGLIIEFSKEIRKKCADCIKIGECLLNINKNTVNNMKNALDKLYVNGILKIDQSDIEKMKQFYDKRNKIHLSLTETNEFIEEEFDVSMCKEAEEIAQKLADHIMLDGKEFFDKKMCEIIQNT